MLWKKTKVNKSGFLAYCFTNLTFFSVSRFLLQIFVEAKCHDWWFILSLVLRDSTSLTDFIDDVIKLRDTTAESLSRMKDGIESLEAWAEQNW